MFITTALNVLGTDHHITLSFMELKDSSKLPKVRTTNETSLCKVVSVEYWEEPNITVAVVESEFVRERHEYYTENGYTYNHEFIPHFTLGSGDLIGQFGFIRDKEFAVGEEYFRIYA